MANQKCSSQVQARLGIADSQKRIMMLGGLMEEQELQSQVGLGV